MLPAPAPFDGGRAEPTSTMAVVAPLTSPLLPSFGDDFIRGEEDRRENDMWDLSIILY
jgi:hypothetical protein